MTPYVTVIVPCRNEGRFIDRCLRSITASAYPHDRLEILVVDGMSKDGTRAQIAANVERDPRIVLVENEARTAPAAMNLGIARARGEIVMRMDAHCEYPADYIPQLVRALDEHQADNVGGITEVLPAGSGPVARAIAIALSSRAGVGDSHFRVGTEAPRWVDTVPFGCWRRETFTKVGLFDESLPRNQDDEFNMRLRRAGGRVLLLPSVVTRYFARERLDQLWQMFSQYGYYKPLAAIRSGAPLQPRQFAPSTLVVALVAGALLAPFSWWGVGFLAAVAGAYAAFALGAAAVVARSSGFKVAAAFAAALVTMHVAYGVGFLRGTLRFAILRRAPAPAAPELSR